MRRAILLPQLVPFLVAFVIAVARCSKHFEGDQFLDASAWCWLAFVVAAVAELLLMRRTARDGVVAPALVLGFGLLPFAVGVVGVAAALQQEAFDSMIVRGRGAALSTLLLSLVAVSFALVSLERSRRERLVPRLAGVAVALPFGAVLATILASPALDSWSWKYAVIGGLPTLGPAAIGLVALPLTTSRHRPGLAVLTALCLGAAVCTGVAVLSADLVRDMFGIHGCGPATRYEIAVGSAHEVFPVPALEAFPWAPGALSVLLAGVVWASWAWRAHMARALLAGVAVVALVLAGDHAMRRALVSALEAQHARAPSAVWQSIPGFRPLSARASLGPRVTWEMAWDASGLHERSQEHSGDPLATRLGMASLALETAEDAHRCHLPGAGRALPIAVDSRLTWSQLRVLSLAATRAGVAVMYWLTTEAPAPEPRDHRVSTWSSLVADDKPMRVLISDGVPRSRYSLHATVGTAIPRSPHRDVG